MLSEVVKKYENFKRANQKSIQSVKQSIQQQIQNITIQALKIQNHKVSKIHSNQQQIQNRLRKNNDLQAQLKLHLGGWVMLYDELNKSLKEAGDVVNYAQYIQQQVRQMNAQLKKRMEIQILKSEQEKEKQLKPQVQIGNSNIQEENVQQNKEQTFIRTQVQSYEPEV